MIKLWRALPVTAALGCLVCAVGTDMDAATGETVTEEMGTMDSGNNAFACNLYAKLRDEEGNLFFSPFSSNK